MWSYRVEHEDPGDIGGYAVHALDGHIGHVDKHSIEADRSHVIVDTGPWIHEKKVMLPAGLIERIDYEHREIYVNQTKDKIRHAPEYADEIHESPDYRGTLAGYYGRLD
jgi:hypothetical protein